MLLIIANILYVLTAIAMTVLILLQRGAGANAGSGFGGGASATVFGARGSANFLSRSTAVLAGLFFLLSLGMGIYHGRPATVSSSDDLGVMSGVATELPAPASGDVPAATPAVPPSAETPAPVPVDAATPAADPGTPAAPQPEEKKGKDGA